ncbi:MAG: hypothetical protein AAFV07_18270 [Bacteroidota bacterium]
MRPLLRPYHLMLMLAGLTALWVFKKIDKHSFYHHFFRVIEEVELRNSQDLAAADLMVLTRIESVSTQAISSLWPLVMALLGIAGIVFPVLRQQGFLEPSQITEFATPARLLPPVRAP